jgi:hypothetical protein
VGEEVMNVFTLWKDGRGRLGKRQF